MHQQYPILIKGCHYCRIRFTWNRFLGYLFYFKRYLSTQYNNKGIDLNYSYIILPDCCLCTAEGFGVICLLISEIRRYDLYQDSLVPPAFSPAKHLPSCCCILTAVILLESTTLIIPYYLTILPPPKNRPLNPTNHALNPRFQLASPSFFHIHAHPT